MGNQNPIVDLFNEITKDLQIINCDVYNKDGLEFIYYNREKKWIFYQDVKNEEFWCDYNRYWEIFKSEFNLKYEEIGAITKFLVEEALKREVGKPFTLPHKTDPGVEEALKQVEETLKREIGTPDLPILHNSRKVEEALKREVIMPSASNVKLFYQVEDALKRKLL